MKTMMTQKYELLISQKICEFVRTHNFTKTEWFHWYGHGLPQEGEKMYIALNLASLDEYGVPVKQIRCIVEKSLAWWKREYTFKVWLCVPEEELPLHLYEEEWITYNPKGSV